MCQMLVAMHEVSGEPVCRWSPPSNPELTFEFFTEILASPECVAVFRAAKLGLAFEGSHNDKSIPDLLVIFDPTRWMPPPNFIDLSNKSKPH